MIDGKEEVNLIIRDDGSFICLDINEAECFKSIGVVNRKRATHVEPDNLLLRLAFHILRLFFGDKGFMSEFTRHWPCRWRVNITPVGGPILPELFDNRIDAIDAEVAWLNKHFL